MAYIKRIGRSRLLYLILASLLLRGAFQTVIDSPGIRDSYQYSALIRNIAEGKGLTDYYIWHDMIPYDSIPHPHDWMPPLFPILSTGFVLLGASPFLAGKLVSVFAGSLLPVALYLVGKELGGEKVGLLSGYLAAFSAPLMFYSSVAMTDMLFCLLVTLSIFSMLKVFSQEGEASKRHWVNLGLIIGISYLCRPTAVLILLTLVSGWLLLYRTRQPRTIIGLIIMAVCFGAVISPWLVRNYVLLGDPFASVPGYHLWTTHEGAYYDFDYHRYQPIDLLLKPSTWRSTFSYITRILMDLSFALPISGLAIIGFLLAISNDERSWILLVYVLLVFSLAGFNRSGGTWIRHVLPSLPFLLLASSYAGVWASKHLPPTRWRFPLLNLEFSTDSAKWVPLSLAVFMCIHTLAWGWAYQRGYNDLTEIGDTEFQKELDAYIQSASRWFQENTDADTVIMTRHPWHIHYYSRRKTISAVNAPKERIAEIAKKYNATYLLVDNWLDWSTMYEGPYSELLANQPVRGFELKENLGGPFNGIIYQFDPEEYEDSG